MPHLNPNQPDFAVLWYEAISGRNAEDVASSYLKIIERSGAPEITFWTDNCSGQNKNWFLFTTLAKCVNQGWGPNLLRMKYLEKGHTFMRAGVIHDQIGKLMKKAKIIATFDDFVEIVDKSGRKVKPIVMNDRSFYDIDKKNRSKSTKKVTMPLLEEYCPSGVQERAQGNVF